MLLSHDTAPDALHLKAISGNWIQERFTPLVNPLTDVGKSLHARHIMGVLLRIKPIPAWTDL